MSRAACCVDHDATSSPPSRARRGLVGFAQWSVPLTVLALVAKRPAYVAAYVLLLTGVGLPLPTAAAARWSLVGACVAGLIVLIARTALRVHNLRAGA